MIECYICEGTGEITKVYVGRKHEHGPDLEVIEVKECEECDGTGEVECTECKDDNPWCAECGDPDAGVDAFKEGGT